MRKKWKGKIPSLLYDSAIPCYGNTGTFWIKIRNTFIDLKIFTRFYHSCDHFFLLSVQKTYYKHWLTAFSTHGTDFEIKKNIPDSGNTNLESIIEVGGLGLLALRIILRANPLQASILCWFVHLWYSSGFHLS